MSPTFLAKQWTTLCQTARTTATKLAENCSERAAALQQDEVERFCGEPAPRSKQELERAYTHRTALGTRLTALARADALARAHPEASDDIFREVESFCGRDFPTEIEEFLEMQRRNLALNARIAEHCAATTNG